jgi:hypothetical protein
LREDIKEYRWKDGEPHTQTGWAGTPHPNFVAGILLRCELSLMAWRNLCDLLGMDAFANTVIRLDPDVYDIEWLLRDASQCDLDYDDDGRMWIIQHHYPEYTEVDFSKYEKEEWFYDVSRYYERAYRKRIRHDLPDENNIIIDNPYPVQEYVSRISGIDCVDHSLVLEMMEMDGKSDLIQYLTDELMMNFRTACRNHYVVRYMEGTKFLPMGSESLFIDRFSAAIIDHNYVMEHPDILL